MDDLDSVKAMCRSVLMTCSHGVLGQNFAKEYEETTCMVLPLKSLGVRSVMDLPKLMPDVIKAERNAQGQVVFYVVANEKTAHIAKMKSKEKSSSKKNRRSAGTKKMFFCSTEGASASVIPAARPMSSGSRQFPSSRPASSSRHGPVSRPAPGNRAAHGNRAAPSSRPAPVSRPPPGNRSAPVNRAPPRPLVTKPISRPSQPVSTPRVNKSSISTLNRALDRSAPSARTVTAPSRVNRAVPAEVLCAKIRSLMSEFNQGLWSGNLVSEYETFFKEAAEKDLLDLVLQMEGSAVRIERPYGQNSNRFILYGIEEEVSRSPSPVPPAPVPATIKRNGATNNKTSTTLKYPYTFRYVHTPLPWLGVRFECYVTLAQSPSNFWVQIKSAQLDDLVKITDLIQTQCEAAPSETNGQFYVNELVCGLFPDDQKWYRAIVLDVGNKSNSSLESLDPVLLMPSKPTPQFPWQAGWSVKLFYVDYGNIEWVPLEQVRRKKFPYPNGQALCCSLGSITPNAEWTPAIKDMFRTITEHRDADQLRMTVEAVKSDKAHYGFKSRLNEYCQKRKLDMATFAKPLNSLNGWRTSCDINHPTKGQKTYTGFYQLKKNDAEASAAQHVIRDWDITLLESVDMPEHWIEVILENKKTGEVYNKSLVESGAATADTSIHNIEIPKQPKPEDIPQLKSEMIASFIALDVSSDETDSEDAGSYSSSKEETEIKQTDPDLVDLPEIGSLVYMHVTHVQSPKNICMRNIEGEKEKVLLNMEDDMTLWMKTNLKVLSNVQVNKLCSVYSDSIVYRARVLKLLKNNRAEVLMLDYGDIQTYQVDKLYYLDPKFLKLPYQAISCCLSGLENIINAEQITDFIREKVEEERLMVKVKDIVNERTLSVEMWAIDEEDRNAGENLNKVFLAQDIRNLKPVLPADGDCHAVKLTNVAADGVLSLQITGPGLSSLGELMKELQDYYENNATRASDYIIDPTPGHICCTSALSDGERCWYRAIINRKVNEHTVEVLFVDYGHSQTMATSKLREPAKAVPNVSRLPFQAYSVQLADLPTDAASWTDKEVDTLRGYTAGQTLIEAEVADASGGYPLVRIYLDSHPDDKPKELNKLLSSDRNLFQTIKSVEGLNSIAVGHSVETMMSNMSLANPTRIRPSEMVLEQSKIPRLSLRRESEALISHVDTPYSWYFQSREFNEQFREMSETMNTYYSQPLEFGQVIFREHDICVAYCEQYHGWYRARVLSVSTEGNELSCSMVDYGDVQKVPVQSVRPLVEQFAKIPIQACRAGLVGVVPANGTNEWSDEAQRFFSNAVSERMLWVRIVQQDTATQILWMHIIDTSSEVDIYISNSMVEHGHAVRPAPPQPATPVV